MLSTSINNSRILEALESIKAKSLKTIMQISLEWYQIEEDINDENLERFLKLKKRLFLLKSKIRDINLDTTLNNKRIQNNSKFKNILKRKVENIVSKRRLYNDFYRCHKDMSKLLLPKDVNSEQLYTQMETHIEDNSLILYPSFSKKNSELKMVAISKIDGKLLIKTYRERIENIPNILSFTLFIKSVEELLVLEDSKKIEEEIKSFNLKYSKIDKNILKTIFKINSNNEILKPKISYNYFMNNYRYKLLNWILSYFKDITIKSIPNGTKKIYFSPLEELNTLPLHAIPLSTDSYLIDKYEVIYIPSLTIWAKLKELNSRKKNSQKNLYISQDRDNQRGCHNEIYSCQQYLKGEHIDKIDTMNLKQLIHNKSFNILHLSVHGVADLENPLNSSLIFNNSRLSLLEVHGIQLRANLVLLSACESNLAKVDKVDEILAFERAFLIAGATNIISTFSTINTKRAEMFTTAFYSHLQKSNHHQKTPSFSEAFRQSAIESIDNGNNDWMLFRFMGV